MPEVGPVSPRVQAILDNASMIALLFDHPQVECEHVLIALLADTDGVGPMVLDNLGVDRRAFRTIIEQSMPLGIANAVTSLHTEHSAGVRTMLDRMAVESTQLNHSYQGTEHLLLALIHPESENTARLLREQGLTPESVKEETMRLLGP